MSSEPLESQLGFLRQYGNLHPSKSFYYVTVHPLADQVQVLQRLKLSPAECKICDLYWALGYRIAHVSIIANPDENPGARFWIKHEDVNVPYRYIVETKQALLTTPVVENILLRLSEWFNANKDIEGHGTSDVVRIYDYDIGVK